jgi:tetratricopeptide (TPR) repeat protein
MEVAKTFALAIEEAAKLHPAAEPLLVYASILAPEPIPLFLFSEARQKFGEPLASALAGDGLYEAVAALRSFALLDRETIPDEYDPAISTDTIRLHRLVREIAASRREDEAREKLHGTLIEALAVVYPRDVFEDPNTWSRARRLDAVALALVGGDSEPPAGTEGSTSYLLNRLASYRHAALSAYEQATLLEAQGDLAAAQSLFERALAIRKKVLRPNHPATAISLGNLGRLLLAQGERLRTGGRPARTLLERARRLLEHTLAIHEKELGPNHRHTGASLTNLAVLLCNLGDLTAALPLFERALGISKTSNGPEHPDTAKALFNIARLLWTQGQLLQGQGQSRAALLLFERARRLFKRALVILEKALGPDHPNTATVRNNLASIVRGVGS